MIVFSYTFESSTSSSSTSAITEVFLFFCIVKVLFLFFLLKVGKSIRFLIPCGVPFELSVVRTRLLIGIIVFVWGVLHRILISANPWGHNKWRYMSSQAFR